MSYADDKNFEIVAPYLQRIAELEAQLAAKGDPVSDEKVLKLIQTINYMVGIAERGFDRKIADNELPEKFVLDYVKSLERNSPIAAAKENGK